LGLSPSRRSAIGGQHGLGVSSDRILVGFHSVSDRHDQEDPAEWSARGGSTDACQDGYAHRTAVEFLRESLSDVGRDVAELLACEPAHLDRIRVHRVIGFTFETKPLTGSTAAEDLLSAGAIRVRVAFTLDGCEEVPEARIVWRPASPRGFRRRGG